MIDNKEKKVVTVVKKQSETKPVVASNGKDEVVANTYAEKQATAAANAALKAAIEANSEMSLKEAEKTYAIEKKRHMLNRCKNDDAVDFSVSKLFAPYIGKACTWFYNGVPVTVFCDGKPRKYPKFIAEYIQRKLDRISESNTYKELIEDRLDGGIE